VVDWLEPQLNLDWKNSARKCDNGCHNCCRGLEGWTIAGATTDAWVFANRWDGTTRDFHFEFSAGSGPVTLTRTCASTRIKIG